LVAGIFMTGSGLVASSLVANLLAYFATYSLLVGGGCGVLYHATRLKLRHTFFLKRRVANCIFQSCSVLGKAALPAGVALLAEQFAFKDVLRIVAGITFTTVILGIVSTSDVVKSKRLLRMQMRPRIARGQNDEPISRAVTTGAGKRCWADCEAALVLVCVADGLLVAAMGNLLWALPIYADERGWGARVGAVLLVALHAAELVGRPLVTLLLDLKCWDSRFMYGVLFVVAAGLNTGIALNPSFEATIAICALLGLTKSGLTQFINGILAQRYLDDKVTFRKYLKAFFRSIFFCCATVIDLKGQTTMTENVANDVQCKVDEKTEDKTNDQETDTGLKSGKGGGGDVETQSIAGSISSVKSQQTDKEIEETKKKSTPKTSSAEWTVLICCCAQVFLTNFSPSFAVIFGEPLGQQGAKPGLSSSIYNSARALYFVSGCLAGPLLGSFGYRVMIIGLICGAMGLVLSSFVSNPYLYFLTHGVLISMGFGLANFVSFLNLQASFKRRGYGTGFYMASKAGSVIVMTQLSEYLSRRYGYKWMMRMLGAISLHSIVLAMIQTQFPRLRSSPSTPDTRVSKTGVLQKFKTSMDFTVFREPAFVVLTTMDCLLGLAVDNMFWALPFYAVERGFYDGAGAMLVSVVAMVELGGRFVVPPLMDVGTMNYQHVFTGLLTAAAVVSVGVALGPGLSATVILCGLYGFSLSGTVGMTNVLLIKHLSVDRFPSSLSAKVVFKFAAFAFGPTLGAIAEFSGTYSSCMFAFAALFSVNAVLSALLPFIVAIYSKAMRHRRSSNLDVNNINP
ncbi:unnamed protein product, partial [Notodromas monacha]